MKRVLLATVGVLALAAASSASAADLPARAPYPTKAPAYMAPLYNWTGFYLGAHVGWGWIDFDGAKDNGFLGGGQIGFNYQMGQFVVGVEGDASWTDIGQSATGVIGVTPVTASFNNDWYATIAARLGVAVGPTGNILLYVKGGVAWTDWNVTVAGGGTAVSIGDTETGYVLGAGLEYGFTPNWSAKLEYNYLDFNGSSATFLGTPVAYDLDAHILKAGVNYRFGYR